MKTDHGRLKSRAEILGGPSRRSLETFLRANGLNEVDAASLALEIQQERAAELRRSGRRELFFGAFFVVAGTIVLLHPALLGVGRHGFVILGAAVAGIGLLCTSISKITISDADYLAPRSSAHCSTRRSTTHSPRSPSRWSA